MKRRNFLKYGLMTGAATAVPTIALSDDIDYKMRPSTKNDLDVNMISDNVSDFEIRVFGADKVIDMQPLRNDKPFLNIMSYHRYIMDRCDDAIMYNGGGLDITSSVPHYRITDGIIKMTNGWSLTRMASCFIAGDVITEEYHYSIIQLVGYADFDLTKNIKATVNGVEYNHMGHLIPVRYRAGDQIVVSYERYNNFYYDEIRDKVLNGVWTTETYEITGASGILIAPITSSG